MLDDLDDGELWRATIGEEEDAWLDYLTLDVQPTRDGEVDPSEPDYGSLRDLWVYEGASRDAFCTEPGSG